jgi:hypothetical protein
MALYLITFSYYMDKAWRKAYIKKINKKEEKKSLQGLLNTLTSGVMVKE